MTEDDMDLLTSEGFEQWVRLAMRRRNLSREQATLEVEKIRAEHVASLSANRATVM